MTLELETQALADKIIASFKGGDSHYTIEDTSLKAEQLSLFPVIKSNTLAEIKLKAQDLSLDEIILLLEDLGMVVITRETATAYGKAISKKIIERIPEWRDPQKMFWCQISEKPEPPLTEKENQAFIDMVRIKAKNV
jgi:hypothetical protein